MKTSAGLVSSLLIDIALCGVSGASPAEIATFTNAYFQSQGDENNEEDDNIGLPTPQITVDRFYLEQVWKWLGQHPDISIGKNGEFHDLTLPQAESRNAQAAERFSPGSSGSHGDGPAIAKSQSQAVVKVFASEEQIWMSLAGHSIDHRRIYPLEFICLSAIGSKRESGILQPDLVRLVGQDKRSVPERTRKLHECGYIVKIPITTRGIKTSKLVLKRFEAQVTATVEPEDQERTKKKKKKRKENDASKILQPHEQSKKDDIDAKCILLKKILYLVEQSKVITWDGLWGGLDLPKSYSTINLFGVMISKLEEAKCIKRITGIINHHYTATASSRGIEFIQNLSDIQYIEQIAEKISLPAPIVLATVTKADATLLISEPEHHSDHLPQALNETVRFDNGAAYEPNGHVDESTSHWDPDRSTPHIVQEIVKDRGLQGATNAEVVKQIGGPLYRRPIEQILNRLGDSWDTSQPSHLSHLGLVKDIKQSRRTNVYNYYTKANFQTLVDQGKATWESVAISKRSKNTRPKLDEFGFPELSTSLFQGTTPMTLAEIVSSTQRDGYKRTLKQIQAKRSRNSLSKPTESQWATGKNGLLPDSVNSGSKESQYDTTQMGTNHVVNEPGASGDLNFSALGAGNEVSTQIYSTQNNSRKRADIVENPDRIQKLYVQGIAKKPLGRPPKPRAYFPSVASHSFPSHAKIDRRLAKVAKAGSKVIKSTVGYFPSVLSHTVPLFPSIIRTQAYKDPEPKKITPKWLKDLYGIQGNARFPYHFGTQKSDVKDLFPDEMLATFLPYYKKSKLRPWEECKNSQRSEGRRPHQAKSSNAGKKLLSQQKKTQTGASSKSVIPTAAFSPQRTRGTAKRFFLKDNEDEIEQTKQSSEEESEVTTDETIRATKTTRLSYKSYAEQASPFDRSTGLFIGQKCFLERERPIPSRLLILKDPRLYEFDFFCAGPQVNYQEENLPNTSSLVRVSVGENETQPHLQDRDINNLAPNGTAENLTMTESHKESANSEARHQIIAEPSAKTAHLDKQAPTSMQIETPQISNGGEKSQNTNQSTTIALSAWERQNEEQLSSSSQRHQSEHPPLDKSSDLGPNSPQMRTRTSPKPSDDNLLQFRSIDSSSSSEVKLTETVGVTDLLERKRNAPMGGSVAAERQKIILSILQAANGVFPGDRELWFPFTTVWMKEHQGIRPDRRTVFSARDTLIRRREIKRFTFSFRNKAGVVQTKNIIVLPEVGLNDERVLHVRQKIIELEPKFYMPAEIEIASEIKANGPNCAIATNDPAIERSGPQSKRKRQKKGTRKDSIHPESENEQSVGRKASVTTRKSRKRKAIVHDGAPSSKRKRRSQSPTFVVNRASEFLLPRGPSDQNVVEQREMSFTYNNSDQLYEGLSHDSNQYKAAPFSNMFENWTPHMQGSFPSQKSNYATTQDRHSRPPVPEMPMSRFLPIQSLPSDYASFQPVAAGNESDYQYKEYQSLLETQFQRAIQNRGKIPLHHEDDNYLWDEDQTSDRMHTPSKRKRKRITQESSTEPRQPRLMPKASVRMTDPTASPKENSRVKKLPKKRAPRPIRLTNDKSRKFLIAVLICRTLLGGLDRIIEWKHVGGIIEPEMREEDAQRAWVQVQEQYKLVEDEMQEEFEEMFLEAYEAGHLPEFDFETLKLHDLKQIYGWAIAKFDQTVTAPFDLPGSRTELEQKYNLNYISKRDQVDFFEFRHKSTLPRRFSDLHRYPWGVETKERLRVVDNGLCSKLAENWIRASLVASEKNHDPERLRLKMSILDEEHIDQGFKLLLSTGIIKQENKGRPMPGRSYGMSESWINYFRRPVELLEFQRAALFKSTLDESFSRGKNVAVKANLSQGEIMAIVALHKNQRIELRQDDIPQDEWGLVPDHGYRTRSIEKEKLYFSADILPTEQYIYGNPIQHFLEAPRCSATTDEEGRDITKFPIWYDINGDVNPLLWGSIRANALSTLAMRPGLNLERLQETLNDTLEIFELELLMQWIVQVGAGYLVGSPDQQGFKVSEWWYLALGCP